MVRLQNQRPPAHIAPGAQLIANLVIDSYRFESQVLMQPHAAFIGQGNPRIGIV